MADGINDNKFISKNNAGFPDYLDYDALRAEGIDYLGKLSGKIWTDHNVHDPGITILEILIYALLDLGYRTNLPAIDIFTANPADKTGDNNFLTPARILACNPLTITDFRKLLVDIDNVKNAWLEVAQDYRREDYCNNPNQEGLQNDPCCINFLNGLYHVLVELYDESKQDVAISNIKTALLSHRNICEDFIDIKVLCRLPVGICAELELEPGAEQEKVYFEMVEKLREFFSPSPRFYTLQQLLDKGKTIDEAFAGRPLDITDSHGFLDTEEFDNIHLRKSIHLSDLYLVLLEVKGVKKVQRLDVRRCDGKELKYGQGSYALPANHIPDFSTGCSGFRFYRNGIPLSFDSTKIDQLFSLGGNGKAAYKYPSPYLDAEIPKGIYRADLDEYYSIQNEFPRVYGIGEGGLSDTASPARKAKALQLKGFLLFFDQLLANYVSQLKNIRSLFSLSVPEDKALQHTYFINKLDSVPDLQQLVRFPVNGEATASQGSILAFPIDKALLQQWIDNEEIKKLDIEKLDSLLFNTIGDRKAAIQLWQNDVQQDDIQTTIITKNNECVFFYMTGTSDEIALISKRYYKDTKEAANAAATLSYLASLETNYKSYYVPKADAYTFDLELNLATYTDYLQEIAEDADQYAARRDGFLNHLLARFAEQFTDFALLSYGFLPAEELEKKNRQLEEKFLVNYDDISSKRGKGYDYIKDGWKNENISGFEKRFKALSGIEDLRKHSLCNFEVGEYEAQFIFTLQLGRQEFFASQKEFPSREVAQKAAQVFFSGLSRSERYSTEYIAYDQVYAVKIDDPVSGIVYLKERFATQAEAELVGDHLQRMFAENVTAKDVFIASYQYSPKLKNDAGEIVRVLGDVSEDEEQIRGKALKAVSKVNDNVIWKMTKEEPLKLGRLLYSPLDKSPRVFLDQNDFKIDIDNTIVNKPEFYTYEVLDKSNRFKLRSVNEFENEKKAKEDCLSLLVLLLDDKNYSPQQDSDTQKWIVQVADGDKPMAVSSNGFATKPEAEKASAALRQMVDQLRYHLAVDQDPYTWKFRYALGYGNDRFFTFESEQKYYSEAEALAAARGYTDAVGQLGLQWSGNSVQLAPLKRSKELATGTLVGKAVANEDEFKKIQPAIDQELVIQQDIHRLRINTDPAAFDPFVDKDPLSKQGQFVYRLVDKDGKYALYNQGAATEADAKTVKKEAIAKGVLGYPFLRICLRGDMINKRVDSKTKIPWYHYQLKAENVYYTKGELAGKKLVLFESVRGYVSEEIAAGAFTEKYLSVFMEGLIKDNYGKNKKINTEELLVHAESSGLLNEPLVFIPKATLDELGAYEEQSVEELIKIANSFPVRKIKYDPSTDPASEWNKKIPCGDKPSIPGDKKPCGQDANLYYYYFALYNKDANKDDWYSARYYLTAEEAWKDFEFFIILIKYHGNYYIDCSCDGNYFVYIREVLAESTARFIDKKSAWGKNGVEKFICVTQSPNTFHTLLNARRCCYGFYVACENKRIQYPCKFDTPKRRDNAINQLYLRNKKINEQKAFTIEYINEAYILKNKEKAFARLSPERRGQTIQSCRWAELILAIKEDKNYQDNAGAKYILTSANGEILAEPVDNTLSLEEWKVQLKLLPAFYESMIVEKAGDTPNQKIKYCIDLQATAKKTVNEKQSLAAKLLCPEDTEDNECEDWQTPCCFGTRQEALEYLVQIFTLLSDYTNYQPVFDCVCDAFGIALHAPPARTLAQSPCLVNNQPYIALPAENEIIAFSPNCYPTPEMVCAAVQRAKQLINSEGLHLVEHILLRPRCKPSTASNKQDCGCGLQPCYNSFAQTCDFPYWTDHDDDDPCDTQKAICFVPGSDPYSFIATIALPAWPERFRKPENRAMLEMMLHREAPAHVLLRILWLAPHDFCCFEQYYRSWNRWLTQDGHCYDTEAPCDLINFLFHQPFACLDNCLVCEPCNGSSTPVSPCDAEKRVLQNAPAARPLLESIGLVYCWPSVCVVGYEFEECDKKLPGQLQPVVVDTVAAFKKTTPKEKQPLPQKAETEKAAVTETTKEQQPEAEKLVQPVDAAEKRKMVNSRFTAYKKELDQLAASANGNKNILKARRFLENPDPSPAEYNDLVQELVKATQPKAPGKKKSEAKWLPAVLSQVTLWLLDKYSFNGKEPEALAACKDSFALLSKAGIDLNKLYLDWKPAIVEKYKPGLHIENIKKLLTG